MIKIIKKDELHYSTHGWLRSRFHFSFADYYNPENMHFGAVRVINDDVIAPLGGFPMHPHSDMEIVTYVIKGELSHADSMGNTETLTRGQIQYMSAGTGITHSEFNNHKTDELELLQIWIMPDTQGLTPNYGDEKIEFNIRNNKWLNITSKNQVDSLFNISQDLTMKAINITDQETYSVAVKENRQVYLINIEGTSTINGHQLNERDSLTSISESLTIKTDDFAHILIMEMPVYE